MLFDENNAMLDEQLNAETLEGDQLIMEAILDEAGVAISEEEAYELISEQILSERSIVRLDKYAKRSLAEKKAVIIIARENNDPLYKKLVTVYKMKKKLISKLVQKYGTRAKSRVRKNASNKKITALVKNAAAGAKSKSLFRGSDMPGKK